MRSVLGDFGVTAEIHVKSAATAAIGMVHRLGLGRVRHLAVADLWVQERVRAGDISVSKWPGQLNPADQMTKHATPEVVRRSTELAGWFPQTDVGECH